MDWYQVFAIIGSLGGFGAWIWSRLDRRFDKIEQKLEKLDDKVNSVDKRLFAVEAILQMKECCMLRDDSQLKKAE